ncbi:MAG: hypothetical protein GF308_11825 [Candidatus Heimdallarchaeota archaeon]|nr:hypothetical protein [Candidatus Heimdallarchaeota archaeon]
MNLNKKVIVILGIVFGTMVISGITVGIWLGVRNSNNPPATHPAGDWTLVISGDQVVAINISINDLLEMPIYEEEYTIRGSDTYQAIFSGVQVNYLLEEILELKSNASIINFIAWDEYSISFSINSLADATILALKKNGGFLKGPEEGNGYLRLIDPPTNDQDYNGPRCLKNVVRLEIV